jgi:hypothetical protein
MTHGLSVESARCTATVLVYMARYTAYVWMYLLRIKKVAVIDGCTMLLFFNPTRCYVPGMCNTFLAELS